MSKTEFEPRTLVKLEEARVNNKSSIYTQLNKLNVFNDVIRV